MTFEISKRYIYYTIFCYGNDKVVLHGLVDDDLSGDVDSNKNTSIIRMRLIEISNICDER